MVEQDYWAAAIEFADSVGVDLVNTSLGYYSFDDPAKNYRYRDLNGHYALMSREAAKAADKGMVVVCSAGNSGTGSWKKITPPGDAENVLTVGAVDKEAVLAPFSSVGNTADHRIKPDVVAVGLGADVYVRTATREGRTVPLLPHPLCAVWWLACGRLVPNLRQRSDRVGAPFR